MKKEYFDIKICFPEYIVQNLKRHSGTHPSSVIKAKLCVTYSESFIFSNDRFFSGYDPRVGNRKGWEEVKNYNYGFSVRNFYSSKTFDCYKKNIIRQIEKDGFTKEKLDYSKIKVLFNDETDYEEIKL